MERVRQRWPGITATHPRFDDIKRNQAAVVAAKSLVAVDPKPGGIIRSPLGIRRYSQGASAP